MVTDASIAFVAFQPLRFLCPMLGKTLGHTSVRSVRYTRVALHAVDSAVNTSRVSPVPHSLLGRHKPLSGIMLNVPVSYNYNISMLAATLHWE